jgi:hypothetical protein
VRANLIAALIGMLCVVGCGGGGSSVSGGGTSTPTGTNVQPVTVDSGPTGVAGTSSPAVNTLYTTVTICVPGTTTCQDIDHIQVDTGSSGLRIIASVLTLSLPLQKDANGNAIAECVHFVDGSSWGPIRQADVKMSGEVASNLAVHIIGDAAYQTIPSGCVGTGKTAEDTVAIFGANGILGVGPFIQDCGTSCTQAGGATYFICTSSTACTDSGMALAMQITNPVTAFATDNNGVIIELSAVSGTAASVGGSLIFGIGTQGNNGLGTASVLTLDAAGALTTNYKTQSLDQSFIDSGSNAYYFPDSTIATCAQGTQAPGFFCPGTTLNLSATLVGINGVSSSINFMVGDANSLFSTNATVAAAATLAAPSNSVAADGSTFDGTHTFDWGLPFYFGRNVYTAIETKNTSAGMGPYFAF